MDLATIFNWVLRSSAMASILVAIILFAKLILKDKIAAKWHYALWLLVILRLVMPLDIQSSYSIFNVFEMFQKENISQDYTSEIQGQVNEISKVSGNINMGEMVVPAQEVKDTSVLPTEKAPVGKEVDIRSYSPLDILPLIWLQGAIVLAVYTLLINIRFYLKIRHEPYLTGSVLNHYLKDCKARMGVKKDIPIMLTSKVKSPSLLGVFKPKLLFPGDILKQFSKEDLRYVIMHELSHYKRKDIVINWLLVGVQILHWFNPVVWYAFYRMREDCEVATDAKALTYLEPEERQQYGHTLINLVAYLSKPRWLPVTTQFSGGKGQLKRRINMIKLFCKGSLKWSFIAIGVLLLVGVVGLTNSLNKQSPLEEHLDKATDFDIVSFEDNQGVVTFDLETMDTEHWTREDFFQLETKILLDAIKHFPREDLNYFKKITIRGITEKTKRVFYTVSVSGDTLMKNDWAEIENFESPKYVDNYSYSKNWEVVSRAYRVQGTITDMDITDGRLNSLRLSVIKRIRLPNHPVDVDFTGKTLNIIFNEELSNAGWLKNRIKKGAEIVVTYAQYAIKSTGKVVDGSYLSDIYYVENGEYYNIYDEKVDLTSLDTSNSKLTPIEIVKFEEVNKEVIAPNPYATIDNSFNLEFYGKPNKTYHIQLKGSEILYEETIQPQKDYFSYRNIITLDNAPAAIVGELSLFVSRSDGAVAWNEEEFVKADSFLVGFAEVDLSWITLESPKPLEVVKPEGDFIIKGTLHEKGIKELIYSMETGSDFEGPFAEGTIAINNDGTFELTIPGAEVKEHLGDGFVGAHFSLKAPGHGLVYNFILNDNVPFLNSSNTSNESQEIRLSSFKGTVSKLNAGTKLMSLEEFKQAKEIFRKKREPNHTDEVIGNLKLADFETIQVWGGSLNDKPFKLGLYQYSNFAFQILVTSYGHDKRVKLLQDFYYSPWLFYGESVRFQRFSKGVGGSYNIVTGEFDKFGENEVFDNIFFNDYLKQRNDLSVGDEINFGENKVEVLENNVLMVR